MTSDQPAGTAPAMRPADLDQLVRLALGLPEPGMTVSDDATVGLRAQLHLDSFTASEELRLREILQARDTERTAERETQQTTAAPRPEQRTPDRARFSTLR